MSNSLTFYEREKIEFYLKCRFKIGKIAQLIHRDHSVVSREIKRNKPQLSSYSAVLAEKAAKRRARITNKRKLNKDEILKDYVLGKLQKGWSPEQIAGRLKSKPPPKLNKQSICLETIYQYIYHQADGQERWFPYLRRAKRIRQKRYVRKSKKIIIPERISIHAREEVIDNKERYGDWESDSLLFTYQKSALSVQYERKAMLLRIHRLANKSAEETKEAINQTLADFPQYFNCSMTFDNGLENIRHLELKENFEIETYFCDPYSSWQKGGVENANGLLRYYLPKRTILDKITNEDLYEIQELLNNRPRKSLNYLTPNEVISHQLNTNLVH